MNFHSLIFFFFFNDTATTEIYTLSLHDALPIFSSEIPPRHHFTTLRCRVVCCMCTNGSLRSEEHTSELQSRPHLVCRLLLEKKKKIKNLKYGTMFKIMMDHDSPSITVMIYRGYL